jgi:hypothetical protein
MHLNRNNNPTHTIFILDHPLFLEWLARTRIMQLQPPMPGVVMVAHHKPNAIEAREWPQPSIQRENVAPEDV